jgi:hypothetical protein
MQPVLPPTPDSYRWNWPRGLMLTGAGLTVALTLLGTLAWPRPTWSVQAWRTFSAPPALWALLIASAVVCVLVAAVLTRRALGAAARGWPLAAWTVLLVVAALALVWNAMYAAALSTIEYGAVIPVFHWLFTFVPAVLAGALFGRRGRQACLVAAIGTGVVTLPLFALGWALLVPAGLTIGAVLAVVWSTAILGVAPLVGGVALATAFGSGRAPVALLP